MGKYYKDRWIGDPNGQTRLQRKSGVYYYFVPTKLSKLLLKWDSEIMNDIFNAGDTIKDLNDSVHSLRSAEGIARLLLRAEAISSSYIEGLTLSSKKILMQELLDADRSKPVYDARAAEIVGNIHAMTDAIEIGLSDKKITAKTILNIHKTLCKNSSIEEFGGIVRDRQNWVGGDSYTPLNADYIPPAPEYVMDLLDDLANFCNNTKCPPVLQSALVHAQFESIHPFADGNGRCGRALIHLVLRKRGLATNFVPPISLIMATHTKSYEKGLMKYRFDDADDLLVTGKALNEWVTFFVDCCLTACKEADKFEKRGVELNEKWREKLKPVRKNSSLDYLLKDLPGLPVFTIGSAAETINMPFNSVSDAINRCAQAGIVKQINSYKRNMIFEVPEVLKEFNIFERRLASPSGNTSTAKPSRKVPSKIS